MTTSTITPDPTLPSGPVQVAGACTAVPPTWSAAALAQHKGPRTFFADFFSTASFSPKSCPALHVPLPARGRTAPEHFFWKGQI